MLDFADARERMVERQIARRGVSDPAVLAAMRRVPREAFVPRRLRELAHEDMPLPIEAGQTISQPYIVAAMIAAAAVQPGDKALEIGAGSGYSAAVLAEIAGRVVAVERHETLARGARRRLAALGYGNVEVHTGDGTLGWPDAAPFDVIIATAGGPRVPQTWLDQLSIGGRLVMPVGESPRRQRLMKMVRKGEDAFEQEQLGEVMFVPLIGEHGWDEREDRAPRRRVERRPSESP
jgi:protein-L-isoaspartate(D-aspartate) O-methyltransferase